MRRCAIVARVSRAPLGFTVIELMISILISVIVTAAVITVFITTLRSNSDAMNMMRLNQELRSVMTLVTRDIKRSGYWGGPVSIYPNYPATYNSMWPNVSLWVTTGFIYAYDVNDDGIHNDATEIFTFRWDGAGTAIQRVIDPLGAPQAQPLTDPTVVQVTSFQFTVRCTDGISVPRDCPGTGIEIRDVDIVLIGSLLKRDGTPDPMVFRRIQDRVRIRNDFSN